MMVLHMSIMHTYIENQKYYLPGQIVETVENFPVQYRLMYVVFSLVQRMASWQVLVAGYELEASWQELFASEQQVVARQQLLAGQQVFSFSSSQHTLHVSLAAGYQQQVPTQTNLEGTMQSIPRVFYQSTSEYEIAYLGCFILLFPTSFCYFLRVGMFTNNIRIRSASCFIMSCPSTC